MNRYKWLYVVLIGVVLVLVVMPNHAAKVVEAQGCSGQLFMEPTDPYPLGTHVILRGTSNCGTVRFEIRNPGTGQSWVKAETGQPNQTETWKTEEFGSGTFEVCFVARGSGGWHSSSPTATTILNSCAATPVGRAPATTAA